MSDFVSTELKTLAGRFTEHDHEGLVMSGDELRQLASHLRAVGAAAYLLEREVFRYRRADAERQARDRLTSAMAVPNTNIRQFPKPN